MRRTRPSRSLLGLLTTGLAAGLVGCSSVPVVSSPRSTGVNGATTSTGAPNPAGPGRSRLRLEPVDSCATLLARLRSLATGHVTAWGLDSPGPYGYGYGYAGDVRTWGAGVPTTMAGAAATAPASRTAAGPTADAAGASSGTNTQEAGVDEGDQVDNDGRHVFSVLDGRLRVLDTVDGTQASVSLPANTGPHQLVLDGGRLVVVSPSYVTQTGEDVVYGASDGATAVTVFDVSDAMHPTVVKRRVLDGQVVAVRSAKGTVRIVLTSRLGSRLAFVQPAQGGATARQRAEQLNLEAVSEATIDEWLPRVGERLADGTMASPSRALACDRMSLPNVDSGLGVTWVASIDTTNDLRGAAGVVAAGTTVYATADGLYVTTTQWRPQPSNGNDHGASTTVASVVRPSAAETAVHRFALGDGGAASYQGSGIVPGLLLNSYSMSEDAGVLRMATTIVPEGGAAAVSGIHVLRLSGGELVELGSVSGMGQGEQIRAVRFIGSYGYVVTFRQTDPLYVVDLRDPAHPQVAGELKIPGYSAYLHPLDDGRLLGIGQDATDRGRVTGLQVSLFDVRDPQHPVRLANLDLGGNSTAEWDPHAFLWWPGTSTAYVPVQPWSPDQAQGGLAGVRVGDATLATAGTLASPAVGASTNTPDAARPYGQYAVAVQRAMVVGGRLVAVSQAGVRIADPATLVVERDVRWS